MLSDSNIPPECISKVVDFKDNVLYINNFLNQIAPGDRKANLDLGAATQRAVFYIKVEEGMKSRPAESSESATALNDRDWIKSYDRNFNDEQSKYAATTFNLIIKE